MSVIRSNHSLCQVITFGMILCLIQIFKLCSLAFALQIAKSSYVIIKTYLTCNIMHSFTSVSKRQ